MGEFSEATAVRRVDEHTWEGEVRPGWDIGGNANGGYLLVLAARAMVEAAERPDPVSVTAHFLAPGRAGPVRVEAERVKAGSRFASVSAALHGPDRRLVQVLGTFGDLAAAPDPPAELVEGGPPDLPPPEECWRMGAAPVSEAGLGDDAGPAGDGPPDLAGKLDMRLHPDDATWVRGVPSGSARIRGWFRFPDGEAVDTTGLLQATDAFPPTAFNMGLPVGWTPTLELTTHVRARPAPGWLAAEFTTRFVTGGFLEEDGLVWDATGALVAQSRQLALVPRG